MNDKMKISASSWDSEGESIDGTKSWNGTNIDSFHLTYRMTDFHGTSFQNNSTLVLLRCIYEQ